MIKGHSGTPRPADREPSILVLQEDSSSGTLSPPRRTLSVSPNENRPPGHITSFMREGRDARYQPSIPGTCISLPVRMCTSNPSR